MNRGVRTIFSAIFFINFFNLAIQGVAQPCLSDWTYRVPVTIDNPGSAATNIPVRLNIDSRALVNSGKMRFDGADVRVTDASGAIQSHWFDPAEMNTASTDVWFSVNSLPNGSTVFYLFYGNSNAEDLSDGESTFQFYDDFSGGSLNTSKWDVCGSGSVTVNNGTCEISRGAIGDGINAIITKQSFNENIIVEAGITAVTGSGSHIGLEQNENVGYALYYESASLQTMQLKVVAVNASCYQLNDQAPDDFTENALNIGGTWMLEWPSTGSQLVHWPGAVSNPVARADVTHTKPSDYKGFLGIDKENATLEIDWVRIRKSNTSNISTSLGAESITGISADITSNDPLCEGEDLEMSVPVFGGATYSWTGPSSYSATGSSVLINNVTPANAGLYQVSVLGSGACAVITSEVNVVIHPSSDAGSISGSNIVCEGSNSGTVSILGEVGEVLRWESSLTGLSPWSTIADTSTSISYTDLIQNQYYRAVVQSGTCQEEYSDSVFVRVDAQSNGGYIIGAGEVCYGINETQLTSFARVGDIVAWEYSADDFSTIQIFPSTDTTITMQDLTASTQIRLQVKNGICPVNYSIPSTIKVNPLPQMDFSADTACFGTGTIFQNNTSISEGLISSFSWNFGDGKSSVNVSPVHNYGSHGLYTARLLAISGKGCMDSLSEQVLVNPLPVPAYTFNDACQGEEVIVSNSSYIPSGSIVDYDWNFGDGNTSGIVNPTHIYNTSGEYPITLVLESNNGCFDSLTQNVSVFGRSDVSFTADSVCDGVPAQFINNSSSTDGTLTYIWNFGDGNTSNSINPSHLYLSAGTYTVTLQANSAKGCSDETSQVFTVNPQPVAQYSVNDECLSDSARFINTSFISGGTFVNSWTFGDGNFATIPNPTYKYSVPGIYNTELTVRSDKGCESSATKGIEIFDQPVAKFVVNPVCFEEVTTFQNLSEGGKFDVSYQWSFGDGFFSTIDEPTHAYATFGDYTSQLIARTEVGCTDTVEQVASVWPLPETQFTVDDVCDGFPSDFNNLTVIASGEVDSYQWDFGDGGVTIQQSPIKQYLNAGEYNVKLIALSDQGCKKEYVALARVKEVPIANFTFENECEGIPIQFNNSSYLPNGQILYDWNFQDGNTSNLNSPSHLYSEPGSYEVELKLEVESCRDSISKLVTVYELPFAAINEDTMVSKGFSAQLEARGGVQYFWEPIDGLDNSDIPNPIATPEATTTYTAFIEDDKGCRVTRDVTVFVNDDYIISPTNVITPDGNGKNDTWTVWNIESYPDNQVYVYNRWGQEVFAAQAYQNDWGGLSGTDLLPDGTYYYLIVFEGSGSKYSGALTILRNKP